MQVIPQFARNARTFHWEVSRLACLLPRANLVPRLQKYLHVSVVCHVEIFGEVRDDFMFRLVKSLWARQQTTRDCEHAETRLSLPLPVVRSWHRIIGLYTIYETVKIPAGIARLGKALANMD